MSSWKQALVEQMKFLARSKEAGVQYYSLNPAEPDSLKVLLK